MTPRSSTVKLRGTVTNTRLIWCVHGPPGSPVAGASPEDAPRLQVSQGLLVEPQHLLLVGDIGRRHFYLFLPTVRPLLSPSRRAARCILGLRDASADVSTVKYVGNAHTLFLVHCVCACVVTGV